MLLVALQWTSLLLRQPLGLPVVMGVVRWLSLTLPFMILQGLLTFLPLLGPAMVAFAALVMRLLLVWIVAAPAFLGARVASVAPFRVLSSAVARHARVAGMVAVTRARSSLLMVWCPAWSATLQKPNGVLPKVPQRRASLPSRRRTAALARGRLRARPHLIGLALHAVMRSALRFHPMRCQHRPPRDRSTTW